MSARRQGSLGTRIPSRPAEQAKLHDYGQQTRTRRPSLRRSLLCLAFSWLLPQSRGSILQIGSCPYSLDLLEGLRGLLIRPRGRLVSLVGCWGGGRLPDVRGKFDRPTLEA